MNRHEGVSCDACLKGNFRGRRYKCLMCFDYDLCAQCYEQGATTTRHTTDHPMQCILTRADYELYYGGEVVTMDQPQSFTCPYCNSMGFNDASLQEHVSAEHSDTSFEVVCPVCASMVGGDPNMVTDDLAAHLSIEHRAGGGASGSGPRDLISFLDEPNASGSTGTSTSRHGVRRTTHGTRGVGGARARRSNMHFSSSGGLSSLSPSARDTVDPIAELLSQLSGVRRSAGGGTSVGSSHTSNNPTQLQQLQMQLQLERQQAARQQLERLPRRQVANTAANNSTERSVAGTAGTSAVSVSVSGGGGGMGPPPGMVPASSVKPVAEQTSHAPSISFNNQFLLSSIEEPLSDEAQEKLERLRVYRSQFVQEILLATISEIPKMLPQGKEKPSKKGLLEKNEKIKDKEIVTKEKPVQSSGQVHTRTARARVPRGRGRPVSGETTTLTFGSQMASECVDNASGSASKGCDIKAATDCVNRSKNSHASKSNVNPR